MRKRKRGGERERENWIELRMTDRDEKTRGGESERPILGEKEREKRESECACGRESVRDCWCLLVTGSVRL